MQFSKLDSQTIRITETKPIITDYKLDELLAKKAGYETSIKEIDERINLATANWKSEQAEIQKEIDNIDSIIAECEKLNIKSEEKTLISEDEVVPTEKEV